MFIVARCVYTLCSFFFSCAGPFVPDVYVYERCTQLKLKIVNSIKLMRPRNVKRMRTHRHRQAHKEYRMKLFNLPLFVSSI